MTKPGWSLKDLETIKPNGVSVFSCFHCGGGSTMGYKLAGCNVLGGVEIDPKMMAVYCANFNPTHSYLMGVAEFNEIADDDLPKELFDLDILDGSPPCSSFSMAGNREKDWGKSKKFREGQSNQVLDDLFFHFIETANKLKPKIVIAENVVGILLGKAKGYCKEIFRGFRAIGYEPQVFRLNAKNMGVSQARERVFFVARRIDLDLPRLSFTFSQPGLTLAQAFKDIDYTKETFRKITPFQKNLWEKCKNGASFDTVHPNKSCFAYVKLSPFKVAPTTTTKNCFFRWDEPRLITKTEILRIQSFPDDYNFLKVDPVYICGMSVPPLMTKTLVTELLYQIGWANDHN